MKIWLKFIIGIALGGVIALLIPREPAALNILNQISLICINIGKYAVLPLLFFSLTVAVYELKAERKLAVLLKHYFLWLALFTLGCALLGIIAGIVLPALKLPQPPPEIAGLAQFSLVDSLKEHIFPDNLLRIFTQVGFSIFPLLVLAFLIGLSLDYEKQFTRPVFQLADGISRIAYHINSLVIEIFWIAIIALSAARFLLIKNLQGGEAYLSFFIVLSICLLLIIFVGLPLFLYFTNRRKNPFLWLHANLGLILASLFSGDNYLSTALLVRLGKENMSVSRKIGSLYSLSAFFSKAGTALVVSLSLIFLRKSALGGEIPFLEYLWIFGFSIVASLLVGLFATSFPTSGAYAALAFLTMGYIQPALPADKYLDFGQIAPLVLGVSALLDSLITSAIVFKIAQEIEAAEDIDPQRWI